VNLAEVPVAHAAAPRAGVIRGRWGRDRIAIRRGQLVIAPWLAEPTLRAYFASTPVA
jgi:hypothetical protein